MPQVRRGSARLSSEQSLTAAVAAAAATPATPTSPLRDNFSPSEPALAPVPSATNATIPDDPQSSQPVSRAHRASSFSPIRTTSNDPANRPTVSFKTQSVDQIPSDDYNSPRDSSQNIPRRHTLDYPSSRRSLSYAQRPREDAYYDSRAATREEYHRRGHTLQEYYDRHPDLLPQLPFTWHHGRQRFKLWLFAFLVFVDASAVPIALYYGLHYAGHVEGWIIFAVVTTIWGGPTYLELAIRTLRLIKKERFYRPLGTDSRWCFDMTTWVSLLTIFVVTTLFIVGSAPHNVWLRVLCMPAPALLYCLGGWLLLLNLYNYFGWPAPFRISSTAKGEKVLPPVYYFMEDVVAVNASAGRPYREALASRYAASPRFRRMLLIQSWFWAIPALVLAIPLTIISVIPQVPATGAYGVAWAVPFLWAVLWGLITIWWCKKEMVRERLEWESGEVPAGKGAVMRSEENSVIAA
ncbi:hypothetical protein NLU13_7230 [Sarocladium strictum]|uniref:Uncharacterized protein n=1 Tax=Sarocladium strictum TaxID=5046 RepID=A0AA39L5D6_SARSR|nr:hypothetical protein NLU13_7230 [Sarocladium strictum]